MLDIYGQNHDAALWPDPYRFDPQRFVGRAPDPYELIPQGGADPSTGHRCPGEDVTVALLAAFAGWLARLDYTVPEQDLTTALTRFAGGRGRTARRGRQAARCGGGARRMTTPGKVRGVSPGGRP
ncbi:hypothetical protein [Micromonospora sp. L31]|uniref:hypothetical protein n=1 Tax=Micromonospora sp. L31 TaxID=3452213 RepID=UPI003F8AE36E